MPRPQEGEYGKFYQGYIDKAEGTEVVSVLEASYEPLKSWLASLENVDLSHRYAPGKWSIAQLLQHIVDTERIFNYRALCFGRGETQSLPGFDENTYADAAPAAGRKLKGIAEELLTLRKATIILFRSLEKENVITNKGIANHNTLSVNAIGFIMVGHVMHHQQIIKERYLTPAAS